MTKGNEKVLLSSFTFLHGKWVTANWTNVKKYCIMYIIIQFNNMEVYGG